MREGSGKFPSSVQRLERREGPEFRIWGVWRERGSLLAGWMLVAFLGGRSCWFVLRDCSSSLITALLEDKAGHALCSSGRPRRLCMRKKKKERKREMSRATTAGLTTGFVFFSEGNPHFASHLGRLRRCSIAAEAYLQSPFVLCGGSRSPCLHMILQSTRWLASIASIASVASVPACVSVSSFFFFLLLQCFLAQHQPSIATAEGYSWKP